MDHRTKVQIAVVSGLTIGAAIGVFINFLISLVITRLVSGDWFLAPVTIPLTILMTVTKWITFYRLTKAHHCGERN